MRWHLDRLSGRKRARNAAAVYVAISVWMLIACTDFRPAMAQTPNNKPLPSESQLPSTDGPADQFEATEKELPSEAPKPQLPGADVSEGVVPGADNAAQDPKAGTDDVSGDSRPRLRLAFDGHTGPIRTTTISPDGKWMASAGEDKDVHVWSPQDSTPTGWFHRRTIRWQVNRSQRGRIYCVASRENEVAFGGYGAMGGNGEIWIVDAISGNLVRSLVDNTDGHRQVVVSLAWAPDGSSRLVSADMEGKVILWQADPNTGLWSHRTLVDIDRTTYGDAWADALKTFRDFVPLAWLGPNAIVVPLLTGTTTDPANALLWKLARFDLNNTPASMLEKPEIIGSPITLAASKDGKRLVTSDRFGTTTLVRFAEDAAVANTQKLDTGNPAIALTLSPNGERLYVGTFTGLDPNVVVLPSVQSWDIKSEPANQLSLIRLAEQVRSVSFSASPRQIIAAVGTRLAVIDLDEQDKLSTTPRGYLDVPAGPILDVRFRNEPNSYEIGFGSAVGDDGKPVIRDLFDLKDVRLLPQANITAEAFVPRQRLEQKWNAQTIQTPQGQRSQLLRDGEPRGVLPLKFEHHGAPTAIATLSANSDDPTQSRDVVIVGTNGENNIYVYAGDASDPPRLIRQYRGHSGSVLALATSADGRYLASSSADATICVWKLDDLLTATETENRWGVDFEVQNDRLIALDVRDDGPLFFRGVRGGDRLVGIKWSNAQGTEVLAETDSTKMLERLRTLEFDTQVVFDFTRLGRALPGFQSYAAWQPLATLFVDTNREWAFWTPAGYYNASINGHQHFGWQINRGVDQLPEYFRAAQFKETLERPDVMRKLLETGSLGRAMQQTVGAMGPPPGEDAIVNQYKNKPRIEILEPVPGKPIQGNEVDVVAKIHIPLGATLARPKAFVSGVPAVDQLLIADEPTENGSTLTYRWTMRLPSEPQLKLEVIAATEAAAVDRVVLDFEHTYEKPTVPPRLHVLAIGISDYRDRQIQSLDFAARATDVVANLFRSTAAPLYRVTTDQLIDSDATRPMWRVFASQAADELAKTVTPDDLVVMYLCGHGLRDRLTGQWYFVTADARYNDLMNDQYGDCLSFNDLSALSALPCRKLAILDSCHSGAVQTMMRSDDLKSALRFLQDDVVLTLTASEGDEEAAEQRESKLGRFTSELVTALNGDADREGNADGVVTLRETIEFVTRRVADASEKEGAAQHPTASPEYLLKTLELPLATVK